MTKEEAIRHMRNAFIASMVAVSAGLVITLIAFIEHRLIVPVIVRTGALLVIGLLGYGLKRKSRVCGIALCCLFVGSLVMDLLKNQRFDIPFGHLAIIFFLVLGTIASFRWHHLSYHAERA